MSQTPLILIVDDEPSIVELTRFHLERNGFATLTAFDGLQGLELARNRQPDLVLLDLMLPGLDGFEVCRRLRQESDIPVVMLTAKQDEIDKVLGLEIGADDYITKPFSPRELIARIKAVLRRRVASAPLEAVSLLEAGPVRMDASRFRASVGDRELELTKREFELLYLLASHSGQAFSREHLVERLWGYDYDGDTRTVDVHIRRLRAKLGIDDLIETVHGIGYRFREEP